MLGVRSLSFEFRGRLTSRGFDSRDQESKGLTVDFTEGDVSTLPRRTLRHGLLVA